MKRYLSALFLMGACMTIAAPGASAQESSGSAPKKTAKKTTKKAPTKKKHDAKQAPATANEEDVEPDITGSTSTDYQCELGNNLTIFESAADDKHIALRWKKRLLRLTRVSTTTGANRYENHSQGLVWIGIPAKGMLLDSKKGQQLANECKSPDQQKAQESKAPAAAEAAAPSGAPETAKQ